MSKHNFINLQPVTTGHLLNSWKRKVVRCLASTNTDTVQLSPHEATPNLAPRLATQVPEVCSSAFIQHERVLDMMVPTKFLVRDSSQSFQKQEIQVA